MTNMATTTTTMIMIMTMILIFDGVMTPSL